MYEEKKMYVLIVKEVIITRKDNAIVIQRVDTYSFWGIGNGLILKLSGSIWVFTVYYLTVYLCFMHLFLNMYYFSQLNRKASRQTL